MKLISYLRVSGAGQLDGYGLDAQRKAVKAWARTHGHKIVAEFVDEAVSGTRDAVDRPGLSEAIAALRQPRPTAEGLLLPKLDRLARALTVQEAALALVWREGASVFTAESGEVMRDDPDDPMRTAMRQMVGVFAELDRRMVVKRMRDGRSVKADARRHAVGQYAFGYRGEGKGRERDAAPEPQEQAAVQRILALRGEGKSYRQIAATLDVEGLRPRRAASWSAMAVRSVVQRAQSVKRG